ncbi:MAG: class I SAM-dependent methyltransferase [Selenomonadaceae bacterium]|nr:class I SAM-dependent methyltransferase [Selenomonadaceae bacterium]
MGKILDAYQLVGDLSKFYDGMLTNSGLLAQMALKIFWGLDAAAYEKFLSQAFAGLPTNFNGRLLEVPVGTGVLSFPRYREFDGAEIFCVDLSDKMLNAAKLRAAQLNLRGIKFFQGDVEQLPFAENFFDVVLSVNGLHVFPNKLAALMESRRVLKVGGTFCGSVYVKGENRRTDLFVEKFCTRYGFFSPPFETLTTLQKKLREHFAHAEVTHVESFAGFVCTK